MTLEHLAADCSMRLFPAGLSSLERRRAQEIILLALRKVRKEDAQIAADYEKELSSTRRIGLAIADQILNYGSRK